jgi:uncharacterized DUF497 family protein
MEFEWDAAKELTNIKKHGVPFSDAVETFFDPKGFRMVDQKHSSGEKRFYWVGKTNKGRVLTTWFTRRGSVTRIIGSAEWRKLRRLYNETTENE